jgi:hypothetical protein
VVSFCVNTEDIHPVKHTLSDRRHLEHIYLPKEFTSDEPDKVQEAEVLFNG